MSGRVVAVMESWPIGLQVEVEGEVVHVQLTADCEIRRATGLASVEEVRPGRMIRFEGDSPSAVDRLEIL